jgi:hypothetical protein
LRGELGTRIDAIEDAYEFMLAFAAQGLATDRSGDAGSQLRPHLTRSLDAIAGLADLLDSLIERDGLQPADRYRAFTAILARDAQAARAAIELVLVQPSISSQLIDNLNASIHVRTLLTDLFLIDEILKG